WGRGGEGGGGGEGGWRGGGGAWRRGGIGRSSRGAPGAARSNRHLRSLPAQPPNSFAPGSRRSSSRPSGCSRRRCTSSPARPQWERRPPRSRRPRGPTSKRMPLRAVAPFLLPQPKPCSRRLGASSATRRSDMDKDTYDRGLTMRRKVLGEEYVDRALKSADDFNRDFQRIVTQYCWGEAWGDDTLTPRERSILNLGMIAALGKMEEFQT